MDKRNFVMNIFITIALCAVGAAAYFGLSNANWDNCYDIISEYMVDLQELAEGNLSGHVTTEQFSSRIPSTIPEDVYYDLFYKQNGMYHFEHISNTERQVYIEILWALSTYNENVEVSTLNNDVISKCFQCVLNDHPEIFYVDGFHYKNYYKNDQLTKITVTGSYTMDSKEIMKYQARIDACVDQILENIPDGADEYAKAKYIYEYIIKYTDYDADSENNQNILSVFLNGKSVCQGYTKSVQYLLQKLNMNATTILGYVEDGRHSWNLVMVNGKWYYIDATWGDYSYPIYATEDYSEINPPDINYDYLLITTDELKMTHYIDTVVDPPVCISITDNFYVREGLYFDVLNKEAIRTAFEHGYENNWKMVTLKCASSVVYDQLKMYLIYNQEVFQYLHNDYDTIMYFDNMSNCSVSFWL